MTLGAVVVEVAGAQASVDARLFFLDGGPQTGMRVEGSKDYRLTVTAFEKTTKSGSGKSTVVNHDEGTDRSFGRLKLIVLQIERIAQHSEYDLPAAGEPDKLKVAHVVTREVLYEATGQDSTIS